MDVLPTVCRILKCFYFLSGKNATFSPIRNFTKIYWLENLIVREMQLQIYYINGILVSPILVDGGAFVKLSLQHLCLMFI